MTYHKREAEYNRSSPIIIVTPTSNLKSYPRFNKLMALFEELGLDIEHWYWKRDDAKLPSSKYPKLEVFHSKNPKGDNLVVGYAQYIIKLLYIAVKLRPKNIYAIGFVSALPFAIVSIFTSIRYIFDNNDNFSESYPWPKHLKRIIMFIERFVARRADVHIVPSQFRWDVHDKNLKIIPNVPSKTDLAEAYRIHNNLRVDQKSKRFAIYINGLMIDTRGGKMLYEALSQLDSNRFEIIIAGRIESRYFAAIAELSNCSYLGEISPVEALARYYLVDIAITLYDPSIEINRKAESTKWGDCMATNTPFIVNNEVITAQDHIISGRCVGVDYGDSHSLAKILVEIEEDPQKLVDIRERLQKIETKPWEDYMAGAVKQLFAQNRS